MTLIESDESSLTQVIEAIHNLYESGNSIFLLRGNLAAGKTTLVKHYAKFIKIHEKPTSPTFAYQQIYGGVLYHYDIYNKELSQYLEQGLLEELEKDGIHFVEWGSEKLQNLLERIGMHPVVIEIEPTGNKRSYKIYHAQA